MTSFSLAHRSALSLRYTEPVCAARLLPRPVAPVATRSCLAACEEHQQQRHGWRQQATADSAAEAVEAPVAAAPADSGDEVDPEQQLAQLPQPSQHHQGQLSSKERATLRAQSEQLAKSKTLQRVQIGNKGVTLNVLHSIMDILMKYEFVRVKLGEGCGLERKQTAARLAELLDAAVVGQVGFTITLYRQKGLPRPDSLMKPGGEL